MLKEEEYFVLNELEFLLKKKLEIFKELPEFLKNGLVIKEKHIISLDLSDCSLKEFPLLKKLTKVGDPQVSRVFKEEIALRFASSHLPVVLFILERVY